MFPCGPTIEPYQSEQCFIPKDPLLMTREAWSHSIPIMIGGTSDEGLFSYRGKIKIVFIFGFANNILIFLITEAASKPNFLESLDFAYFVPLSLNCPRDSKQCIEFGKMIKNYYFGSSNPSMDTIDGYVKVFWFIFKDLF